MENLNWSICRRKQIVDRSNQRENKKRIHYNYRFEQLVSMRADSYLFIQILDERYEGPYCTSQVHVNGTVTISRRTDVLERINIRRIKPFRQ